MATLYPNKPVPPDIDHVVENVAPGTGYRNNATNGIATGGASQGVYMVAAGGHVNSGCCFRA